MDPNCLAPCSAPQGRLGFDPLKNHRWHGGNMTENTRIPFGPSLPTYEYNEGSQGFSPSAVGVDDGVPPILHRTKRVPLTSVDHREPEPSYHHVPNADGVAAFEQHVCGGFSLPLAKLAKATVWPTTALEPFGRPYPVLENKPSEKLAHGRRPVLPNHLRHSGSRQTLKLCFVGGGRRV